jgi:hypothetical protein
MNFSRRATDMKSPDERSGNPYEECPSDATISAEEFFLRGGHVWNERRLLPKALCKYSHLHLNLKLLRGPRNVQVVCLPCDGSVRPDLHQTDEVLGCCFCLEVGEGGNHEVAWFLPADEADWSAHVAAAEQEYTHVITTED